MGTGAQGSTIAMRLDEEPNVARIICADYNLEAAQRLEQTLTKATAVKVDGNKKNEILEIMGTSMLVGFCTYFISEILKDKFKNKSYEKKTKQKTLIKPYYGIEKKF